ncbi:hypothetical protein RFW48_17100, partial [Acinetobacter baumannii]|nr:hypothetical protein [Acinetobacter baumannii]
IVITSSRPIIDPELNIVVKVSEGNATRLQHIKTVLKPSPTKKTSTRVKKIMAIWSIIGKVIWLMNIKWQVSKRKKIQDQ